jgi:hypothetical protein
VHEGASITSALIGCDGVKDQRLHPCNEESADDDETEEGYATSGMVVMKRVGAQREGPQERNRESRGNGTNDERQP